MIPERVMMKEESLTVAVVATWSPSASGLRINRQSYGQNCFDGGVASDARRVGDCRPENRLWTAPAPLPAVHKSRRPTGTSFGRWRYGGSSSNAHGTQYPLRKMKHAKGKLKAPHPRSTAGPAWPAGCGGAKQCFAKPRLRPRPRAGLPLGSLRSAITSRFERVVSH